MPQHTFSAGGIQLLRIVLQTQYHLAIGIDDQRQGEIGLANVFEMPVGPFASLSTQCGIQQIVLKDQNAFEQAHAAGHFAGFLYDPQRSLLIRSHCHMLFTDLAHPISHGSFGTHRNAHG